MHSTHTYPMHTCLFHTETTEGPQDPGEQSLVSTLQSSLPINIVSVEMEQSVVKGIGQPDDNEMPAEEEDDAYTPVASPKE